MERATQLALTKACPCSVAKPFLFVGDDTRHYRTIPRSQQIRQRKGQAFQGIVEYDYAVDFAQAGGSIKSPVETSRQLRPR